MYLLQGLRIICGAVGSNIEWQMTASGLQARRPLGLRPRCFPNPNYRG